MNSIVSGLEAERVEEEHDVIGRRLLEVFRERAISIGTMEPQLRLVTGVALLQVIAAAILVGLRNVRMPSVAVSAAEGQQAVVPTPVFWLVIVFVSLAWSYLLTGVLHGHRLVRLVALGVLTLATWDLWHTGLALTDARMIPSYLILAAVWALGLSTLREPAERAERRRRSVSLALLPAFWLLVAALYLAYWWRLRPFGDPRFFSISVFHQLSEVSFALMPVLFVAGVDFAEWGDVASTRGAALLGRARSPALLAAATAAAGAGVLVFWIEQTSGLHVLRGIGLGAALAACTLVPTLVFRLRRPVSGRVPYAAVFASSLILLGILLGVSYSGASLSNAEKAAAATLVYRHAKPPLFRLEYPISWQPGVKADTPQAGLYYFTAPGASAELDVLFVSRALAPSFGPDPLARLYHPKVLAKARAGGWLVTRFSAATKGGRREGRAWQRSERGALWLLVGIAGPSSFQAAEPAFAQMVASWRPEAGAATSEAAKTPEANARNVTPADRAVEAATFAWLALALVAFAVLRTERRRARPGWLVATCVYFLVAGAYYVLVQLPTLGFTLGLSRDALPSLTRSGLGSTVAVGTLAVVAWLSLRRRLTAAVAEPLALLFALNGGLFAIHWIDRGFESGISTGGRFSIVQAVLVLAALVWDIVMSGEAITNRHNRHFPRHTRVLVYLGYIMLVGTAVLFFSSLHVQTTSAAIEPQFESEGFVENGLLFLGTSLVITFFVLRLSRARTRR